MAGLPFSRAALAHPSVVGGQKRFADVGRCELKGAPLGMWHWGGASGPFWRHLRLLGGVGGTDGRGRRRKWTDVCARWSALADLLLQLGTPDNAVPPPVREFLCHRPEPSGWVALQPPVPSRLSWAGRGPRWRLGAGLLAMSLQATPILIIWTLSGFFCAPSLQVTEPAKMDAVSGCPLQ